MRFILLIVLGLILMPGAVRSVSAGPSLVVDVDTGEVLHADNAGKHWYPASLTKLMTAYLTFKAIKAGQITPETKLIVSKMARSQPPSKLGLPVGASITVKKALEVLIVRSANDIAVVLAEGVGGSVENFAKKMNAAAASLGMTGSYFANPHGLPDDRQMTTARDMALLARALLREYPQYKRIYSLPHVRIGKRRLRNRNGLLRRMKDADGMKTGFVCASGYNLVASATRGGRKLVAVLLGERSGGARTIKAHKLLESGFSNHAQDDFGSKFSLGQLAKISNANLSSATVNLHRKICKRSSPVRVSRPSSVKGWSVVFGTYDTARTATSALKENLLALRHIVFAGNGAVIKNYDTGKMRALIGSLDPEQVGKVCGHLKHNNIPCVSLEPDTLKDPPQLLKKLARSKRRRKARGRKRAKRRGRVTRRRVSRRSANFSEAKKSRRRIR